MQISISRRTFLQQSLATGSMMAAGAGATVFESAPAAQGIEAPDGVAVMSTDGHTIYHLQPATVKAGERAIVAAAYDGAVVCVSPAGKRLWQAPTGGFFPFDLAVADVDGDGLDEVFVASADGKLYALDHDGTRLWVFEKAPPLFQVCIARLADGAPAILAGGVEQVLYKLSAKGELLKSLTADNCIRHLRAGNILGEARDFAAVATTSGGLYGRLSLLLVDPADLTVRWKQTNLGTAAFNSGKRFFSMLIVDLDKDGRDEILLSNSWGEHGRIFAFNAMGKQVFTTTDERIPNISYRMNLLRHVRLADDEFVLGHFGNVLIVYNLDGSCREVLRGPYSFADAAFDPVTRTWYMGSEVSGGDEIVGLRLDRPGWRQAYANVKSTGRLAQIEQNLARLREQVAAFEPPAYQPPPREAVVISRRRAPGNYRHLTFVSTMTLSQKITDRKELWCEEIDGRQRYDKTPDEVVAAVKREEEAGRHFLVLSGHGGAVHFPLSTFERMINAGAKHLWGFEFAEMGGVDAHMEEVLEKILLPLAELCHRRGKHILFRNKNIFWSGTCYWPFWKKMLLNEKYQDVFIPALEETNCRTQELSLAGRVGLWQEGSFNRWSCHVVTDNANFDRMWEYAGHQVLSHDFRQLVSTAALGADVFYNSLSNSPLADQLTPFYDMIEKGIIHIPRREELLSLSDVSLGMLSPPSDNYLQHGLNGNAYTYRRDEQPQMVFDRLDGYWAGTPLPPHDFSNYAMHLDRRMCNFLPENPYGLVPIVPADTPVGKRPGRKFITDGQYFCEGATRHEPAEYRPTVEAALKESAARLAVRVSGPAHWSVVRLDAAHVRVTAIDPGYLDPAEREVDVVLQGLAGRVATDILSHEELHARSGRIKLRIPAGTLRIIDIELD